MPDPFTIAQLAAAGLQAGQSALTALPTKQSRYNRDELDGLLARKRTGQLGLDAKERQNLERTAMDPVRAMSEQARREQEATAASLAGAGGVNAADLAQIRRGEQAAIADAAQQAGVQIGLADQAEAQREEAEIEQRLAAKAARTVDVVGGFSSLVGQTAGLLGQEAGAPPARRLMGLAGAPIRDEQTFTSSLQSAGFAEPEVSYMLQLARDRPGQLPQIVHDSAYGGPMADSTMVEILENFRLMGEM